MVPAEEIPVNSVICELNTKQANSIEQFAMNGTVNHATQKNCVCDAHSQLGRQIIPTMQDCQKANSSDLNDKLLLG